MKTAYPAKPGPEEWSVWCDGSALPNPGRMGLGAVLIDADGARRTLSRPAGATGCNNEAELRAVMAALAELRACGVRKAVIRCDNSVVVQGLGVVADAAPGRSPPRPIARLAALFDEARELLCAFEDARVVWIPAHRNAEADALARAALGLLAPRRELPAWRRKKR